jgi:hypothetical protein
MATKTKREAGTPAKFESGEHDGLFYMSFTGATVAEPPGLGSVMTALAPHALNQGWRVTGDVKQVGTRDLETESGSVTAAHSVYTFAAPVVRNTTTGEEPPAEARVHDVNED